MTDWGTIIIWVVIVTALVNLILKRTGKTFLEVCKDIKTFFSELGGSK